MSALDEKLVIVDYGSQYTQLIARKVRELNVYSEIHPYNQLPELDSSVKGIILSGGPSSVLEKDAPYLTEGIMEHDVPILGICYGAQLLAHVNGGRIAPSEIREYGRAHVVSKNNNVLLNNFSLNSQVWMSHGDTILELPSRFNIIASTEDVNVAAYQVENKDIWGIQFHPEVHHSTEGKALLNNFLDICRFRKGRT